MSRAGDLIEKACRVHATGSAWEEIESFRGEIGSLRGAMPWLQKVDESDRLPWYFEVYPHARRVRLRDREERSDVTLEWREEGVALHVSDETKITTVERYRRRFGTRGRITGWTDLDRAYFYGYSLLTYLSVPFLLRGLDIVDQGARYVTVRFPENFDTHCPVQRFWFDGEGRIARHDYTAEVLGPRFRAAHYSGEYQRVGGVLIATERRVVPRVGTVPLPITILSGTITNISLKMASSPGKPLP